MASSEMLARSIVKGQKITCNAWFRKFLQRQNDFGKIVNGSGAKLVIFALNELANVSTWELRK